MGWLRAVGSTLSRLLNAIILGRTPRFTTSAEAWWMARYGDTEHERATGARLVTWIDRLPLNGPGHCKGAWEDHRAFMQGRIARASLIDGLTPRDR